MGPILRLVFLSLVLSLIFSAGCGSVTQQATVVAAVTASDTPATPPPAAAHFVYGSRGIQLWGGKMQGRQVSDIAGVSWGNAAPPFSQGQLVDVAADAKGRFVYALYQRYTSGIDVLGIDSVTPFTIDRSTGALTLAAGPYPTAAFPTGIAADPSGHFVYISANGSISTWSVNQQSGALTQTGSIPSVGWRLWSSSNGKYLVHAGNGRVSSFAINSGDGSLTQISSLPVPHADCITGSGDNRFLYTWMPGWMPNRGYSVLKLAGDGTLTVSKSVDMTNGAAIFSLSPTSEGKFMYVAGASSVESGSVSAFAVDSASGGLGKQLGATITSPAPAFAQLDFDGRTLYVSSDRWRAYAVNTDGTLTASTSSAGGLTFFRLAP